MGQIEKKYLLRVHNRLIVGFWLLATVVLSGVYTETLFSKSVFQEHAMPFTDLETFVRCLERHECKIITPWLTISDIQELSGFEQLGERFENTKISNPILLASADEIPQKILEENEVFLVNIGPRKTRMQWIQGNKNCSYYVVKIPFQQFSSFPVRKNSTFLRKLNKVSEIFQERGLDKAMDRKYFSDSLSKCQENWSKNRRENDELVQQSLKSMSGAFIFYAIGTFLGMLALIFERILHSLFDKRGTIYCTP